VDDVIFTRAALAMLGY